MALTVLNEDGLAGLSMRRLATKLDVQAPTLYWHFKSKAELYGTIATQFYLDAAVVASAESVDWRSWLIRLGLAMREGLLERRDSAMLCLMARPEEPWRENVLSFTQPLVDYGLSISGIFLRIAPVVSLTLGFVASEQSAGLGTYLRALFSPEHSFREGLIAMVQGLPDDQMDQDS